MGCWADKPTASGARAPLVNMKYLQSNMHVRRMLEEEVRAVAGLDAGDSLDHAGDGSQPIRAASFTRGPTCRRGAELDRMGQTEPIEHCEHRQPPRAGDEAMVAVELRAHESE